MIKLVKKMENRFEQAIFKYSEKIVEGKWVDSSRENFINYNVIDFGDAKHKETFLELDFVQMEIFTQQKDHSEEVFRIYGYIKPVLMLLGLKYSSDPSKQEQLDKLNAALLKVSQW